MEPRMEQRQGTNEAIKWIIMNMNYIFDKGIEENEIKWYGNGMEIIIQSVMLIMMMIKWLKWE